MYLCPSTNTTTRGVSNDLGIRVVQTPRVIHYRKTRIACGDLMLPITAGRLPSAILKHSIAWPFSEYLADLKLNTSAGVERLTLQSSLVDFISIGYA